MWLFSGAEIAPSCGHKHSVVPADAGTQYSVTSAMESRWHGVLDARVRGHDVRS